MEKELVKNYAIVATGGKQYFFVAGETVAIEKIEKKEGEEVIFDTVLFCRTGEGESDISFGTPYVANVTVVGKVVKEIKGKKVIAFRFKRRKKVRTKRGHRQQYSVIRVMAIKKA